jgi:hypothetical protein
VFRAGLLKKSDLDKRSLDDLWSMLSSGEVGRRNWDTARYVKALKLVPENIEVFDIESDGPDAPDVVNNHDAEQEMLTQWWNTCFDRTEKAITSSQNSKVVLAVLTEEMGGVTVLFVWSTDQEVENLSGRGLSRGGSVEYAVGSRWYVLDRLKLFKEAGYDELPEPEPGNSDIVDLSDDDVLQRHKDLNRSK